MIDFSRFQLSIVIPILVVVLLILFICLSLKLPQEFFKDKLMREAMQKRRAEKADLARLEEARALEEMELDEDEEEEEY